MITNSIARSAGHHCKRRGFTLVETLVVIVILAVLATICVTVTNKVKRSAMTARELNAAKNLTTALFSASQDNNGFFPYGVDGAASDISIEETDFRGVRVTGAEAHRYPFRLAPYFGYKFEGITVLDAKMEKGLKNKDAYMISLVPALGINTYGVGGYVEVGEKNPIVGAIRQMSVAHAPERMITFAAARLSHQDLGTNAPGYHMVTPPKTPGGDWANTYSEADAGSWGNVDLRNGDKALVGFLDGSAGLLTKEQIKDMRYWNNQAAILDDPDHRPVVSSGGGRNR